MTRHLIALTAFFLSANLHALDDTRSMARQLFQHYETATPLAWSAPAPDGQQAIAVQQAYVELLAERYGERIGYKAGLTTPAAQQRFSATAPLLGILFRTGYLDSPAQLKLAAGARLLIEADLVVRVADAAINEARDWDALLRNLDRIYPFLEIPDLLYAQTVSLDAALLQAANVGARSGVFGEPIVLNATEDWHRRLAEFSVELEYPDGSTASGRGQAVLGHPLAAVEWLRDAVLARGERLQPGDLLSLGSLTPLRPAAAGRVTARYLDLDPRGPVTLSVDFSAQAE